MDARINGIDSNENAVTSGQLAGLLALLMTLIAIAGVFGRFGSRRRRMAQEFDRSADEYSDMVGI